LDIFEGEIVVGLWRSDYKDLKLRSLGKKKKSGGKLDHGRQQTLVSSPNKQILFLQTTTTIRKLSCN
jgi:hypothetical protein